MSQQKYLEKIWLKAALKLGSLTQHQFLTKETPTYCCSREYRDTVQDNAM